MFYVKALEMIPPPLYYCSLVVLLGDRSLYKGQEFTIRCSVDWHIPLCCIPCIVCGTKHHFYFTVFTY